MLVATVFDLDETLADSAATWQHVIGSVATGHGYAWTSRDWVAIQGTSTGNWSAYLAHRCVGLTAEAAVAACLDGMTAAVGHGRFGLLPGAADLVATAARSAWCRPHPGATSGPRSPPSDSGGTSARS
jgi:hypothetical protein